MRWIVLTPTQAAKYKQYKITPWWGIDPIQTKDGRWVLREDQITEIDDMKAIILEQPKKPPQQIDYEFSQADKATTELATMTNIVELTEKDFPEFEIDEAEPKEIIKK